MENRQEEKLDRLAELVRGSRNIIFFGGAGVSTESGLPDFRSVDGLYHQKYDYPPEEILSHSFYRDRPEEFFRFYRDKLLVRGVEPNAAHRTLAKWERLGKLRAVITQNIDGLHQRAGSKRVLELHGSTLRNYCERCHAFYDMEFVERAQGVPTCTRPGCGGRVKPDVVLYEEGLDMALLQEAAELIRDAELLIIGGTSLAVYPAAGLIDYYRGDHLILINRGRTARDAGASLVIDGSIGEVLGAVDARL
ncbi:NAD-dependent protein deacylase [Lachnoclostridium sp. Marseille-P6806]|uniref:NAD-dependent protein deacylase n=1 Tax=Lachnoclostridium sp. Marseille-P6806 TaxID=2364793 RepID=UPI001030E81F|nr:NAD-dependent protein deacylase [Lachnoclostridium sp. Marseille-P6806]